MSETQSKALTVYMYVKQKGAVLEVNPNEKDEYLECTGNQLTPDRLGRVAYVCTGVPIYSLHPDPHSTFRNLPSTYKCTAK